MFRCPWIFRALTSLNKVIITKELKMMVKCCVGGAWIFWYFPSSISNKLFPERDKHNYYLSFWNSNLKKYRYFNATYHHHPFEFFIAKSNTIFSKKKWWHETNRIQIWTWYWGSKQKIQFATERQNTMTKIYQVKSLIIDWFQCITAKS